MRYSLSFWQGMKIIVILRKVNSVNYEHEKNSGKRCDGSSPNCRSDFIGKLQKAAEVRVRRRRS
jgi:hypothetical protein